MNGKRRVNWDLLLLLFVAFWAGSAVRGLLDGCGLFISAGPC